MTQFVTKKLTVHYRQISDTVDSKSPLTDLLETMDHLGWTLLHMSTLFDIASLPAVFEVIAVFKKD